MQNQNIKGKVVVITGASSGLGEATAKRLADTGAKMILAARRTDRIESVAKDIEKEGGKAIAITTDVTNRKEVQALVDKTVNTYGSIDVMLNNAGLMPQSLLEELKIDEWDTMIDVNIRGVLYGIAAALPYMKNQESGHIINVASVAGHKISKGGAVYSATKYAVRALSEGLRQEVKPYNMRTTVISPGAVDTELTDHITSDKMAEDTGDFYDEHAVSADSFARAIAYAISQPQNVDINEIVYRPTSQEM